MLKKRDREETEMEEESSHGQQQYYSPALRRTPLLMKEEMKTRDEGRRRKRRKVDSYYLAILPSHTISFFECVCVPAISISRHRERESSGVKTRLLSFLKLLSEFIIFIAKLFKCLRLRSLSKLLFFFLPFLLF